VTDSASKPPLPLRKSPWPPAPTILLFVVTALLIGTVQEYRWQTAKPSQTNLEFAEQAFQKGGDRAALKLFGDLANKNNPNAEYWLGHMNEIGLGIPRDVTKAIGLYKKAAEQNIVAAEARLGELYLNGDLVTPDFSQAKSYLERAAYHADPRSAMLLGQMYRAGIGTPVDQKQAYAWSEVASLEGSEFALRERDSSLHDLDVSDQQAAVAHAQEIMKEIKQQTTMPQVPQTK
jgi:TPR repeat protein